MIDDRRSIKWIRSFVAVRCCSGAPLRVARCALRVSFVVVAWLLRVCGGSVGCCFAVLGVRLLACLLSRAHREEVLFVCFVFHFF
mgnify:CR=1 FL=1